MSATPNKVQAIVDRAERHGWDVTVTTRTHSGVVLYQFEAWHRRGGNGLADTKITAAWGYGDEIWKTGKLLDAMMLPNLGPCVELTTYRDLEIAFEVY